MSCRRPGEEEASEEAAPEEGAPGGDLAGVVAAAAAGEDGLGRGQALPTPDQVPHSDLEANPTIPSNNGPVEVLAEALSLDLPLVEEALSTPRLPATAAALVAPRRPVLSLLVTEQTSGPASREE